MRKSREGRSVGLRGMVDRQGEWRGESEVKREGYVSCAGRLGPLKCRVRDMFHGWGDKSRPI